ncbi:twin-arginine translocation signal domain-containing protein, partial [Vibrio alginolyticus]|uniref:twin-arginine translocation signal domain-containing protein n=2 Tax=Bacteria TaxID=2 RepID=UPI004067E6B5
MSEGFSRRRFLGGLGAAAGASAVAIGAPDAHAIGLERQNEEPPKPPLQTATVPFDGAHQAGIESPAQANLWLVAFNAK